MKELYFIWHFDLLEKPSKETLDVISFANDIKNKDFIILYWDIWIEEKILTYLKDWDKWLIKYYLNRLNSCTSICTLVQLSKSEEEIIEKIDWDWYKKVRNIIKNNMSDYSIESITLSEIRDIINKYYIQDAINERLKLYNLPWNIEAIWEKFFRNRATKMLKSSDNKFWNIFWYYENDEWIYIDNEKIATKKDSILNPTCRAIMFSFFYFFVDIRNIQKINFYIEEKHLRSIYLWWSLFNESNCDKIISSFFIIIDNKLQNINEKYILINYL